ncbi:MAG: hypothetical protein ABI467_17760 [Kofleriaceae bacterium]
MATRWCGGIVMLVVACGACSGKPVSNPTTTSTASASASAPADAMTSRATTMVAIDAAMPDAAPPPPLLDAAVAIAVVPTPVPTGCPASLATSSGGPCVLGTRCPFRGGNCFCDGYHGGIPPKQDVDYSHWVCGRRTGRTDGCPDHLAAGVRCKQEDQLCHPQEGMFCGPTFRCHQGRWAAGIDNCGTIPRAPPNRNPAD